MINQLPCNSKPRRSFAFTFTSNDLLDPTPVSPLVNITEKCFPKIPKSNFSSFQVNAFNMKFGESNIKINSKYSEISTEIGNNTHFPISESTTGFLYPIPQQKRIQSDSNINSPKGKRLSIKDKIELVKFNKENIEMTKWVEMQKNMFLKAKALQKKKDEIQFYKARNKLFKAQRTNMRRTKLKLHKLLIKEPNQICENFESKVVDYNTRLLDYMEQPYYIKQSKTFSEKFHFNKNSIGLAYEITDRLMDLHKGQPKSDLSNKIEHNFTEHERKLIMNDPSYFLSRAKTLQDNPILIKKPLSKLLHEEEMKEKEELERNANGINMIDKQFNLQSLTTQEPHNKDSFYKKKKKTISFNCSRLYNQGFDVNKHLTVIENKALKTKEIINKEVYHHHGERLKQIASGLLTKNEKIEEMMTEMAHEIINIGKHKVKPYDNQIPIKLARKEKRESLIMGNQARINNEEREKIRRMYKTEQSIMPVEIPQKKSKKKFALNTIIKIIKKNLEEEGNKLK